MHFFDNYHYSFLTVDANTYLPNIDTVTLYYLRDLMSGAKKRIKNKAVHHISLPAYEGLGINDVCNFLQNHQHVARYLPDISEIRRLPKEFLANVSFTAIG